MNREDIIQMAQECHLIGMRPHLDGIYQESLERFAAIVAAAEREKWMERTAILIRGEREACAKVCEDAPEPDGRDLAERIRARGETK